MQLWGTGDASTERNRTGAAHTRTAFGLQRPQRPQVREGCPERQPPSLCDVRIVYAAQRLQRFAHWWQGAANCNHAFVATTSASEVKHLQCTWQHTSEQGDALGQTLLGLKYDNGEGITEDRVSAYMWWNLTVAQGMEGARSYKKIVAEKMTREQIAEAQRLSRRCLARNYKGC